jgi:hypothetical protein
MPTTSRHLVTALAVVLLADLVGGLLSVATGVNTWADAWGSTALLAAPVPMVVAQAVLTWVAVTRGPRATVVACVLVALACFLSVVSGFFDGGLGNDALTPALSAYQAFLLVATGVLGVAAVRRALAQRTRTSASRPRNAA